MEINIRKGIEMSTNHNERLVITGHEKEGGLKDPYEMAGTGGKVFKGRAIWNRKSCLVFGILCAVGIFLIGMAGGALWSYLRELGYLREIDESCPLCRLKAEGRLRAKNESGLGILQLHTGQMILIDQSGKKPGDMEVRWRLEPAGKCRRSMYSCRLTAYGREKFHRISCVMPVCRSLKILTPPKAAL